MTLECLVPVVTCLVGLCGSGKTPLARDLEATTGAKPFEGILDRSANGTARRTAFYAALEAGLNCTVEEVTLCFPEAREAFKRAMKQFPDVRLHWVYFAKNLESANWNVRHCWKFRGKPDIEAHVFINTTQLMPRYEIPDDATDVRPIVRCPVDHE